MYDPQLGRFITADPTIQHPTDPQDFNRYAYARNNPIKYTDPTGFGFFSSLLGLVGAIVGAVIGNAIAPGVGFFIGAVIGGAIGGAAGGVIDGAINGNSIGKQAIFGAAEGAITGAIVGATGQPTGGEEFGKQAVKETGKEIIIEQTTEKIIVESVKEFSKKVSTVVNNVMGSRAGQLGISLNSTAFAQISKQSKSSSSSNATTLRLFSSRVGHDSLRHMFAVEENGNVMELQVKGVFPFATSDIVRQRQAVDASLRGALNVTVDKLKLEQAFKDVKKRFDNKWYNPADSNRFIIAFLQEAGRPLSEEELKSLGIEGALIPAFIFFKPMTFKRFNGDFLVQVPRSINSFLRPHLISLAVGGQIGGANHEKEN